MIDFGVFVFFFVFYFSWLLVAKLYFERKRRLIFVFIIAALTLYFMAVVFLPDPTLEMPWCTQLGATACLSNTVSLSGNQAFVFAFGSIILPFLALL